MKPATVKKVIIDTDPGVDDAMAILFALACPELEVLALTTVFGNAATERTTVNALAILAAAGRLDVPVAVGADRPIAADYLGPVPQVHGDDGLGDGGVQGPDVAPPTERAADVIETIVRTHPGEVTILALGPLTNLATVLEASPDVADLAAGVVVMGGNALVPGNATPAAEANMFNDPEAADLVLGAAWPVAMVGLDVTHQVVLPGTAIDRISTGASPGRRLLRAALPCYRSFFERTNGLDGIYLHDPTAVAYLVDPDAFVVDRWPVRVETEGISRGKTWPSLGDTDDPTPAAWLNRPRVDVCTGVDADRVLELLTARLTDTG